MPRISSWPVSWNGTTITGTYVDSDGNPLAGKVSFKMTNRDREWMVPTGTTKPDAMYSATLDANGSFSITVPSTDDVPDVWPTRFEYEVVEGVPGGRVYRIRAPKDATFDIRTVAPSVGSISNKVVRVPVDRTDSATVAQVAAVVTATAGGLSAKPIVREYLTTATNVAVPSGTLGCHVTLIQGGGGGGSGRQGAAGTVRCGVGAGAPGGVIEEMWVPASLLGTTYSVTVGAGGAGGAAIATVDTDGAAGGAGTAATFTSGTFTATASGSNGGSGGTASTGTGGAGGFPLNASGASASTTGGTGGSGSGANAASVSGAAGGGAGGGVTSGNVASAGGAGGAVYGMSGGTAGAVGGAVPTGGASRGAGLGGTGAGGGAASITTAAQAGANAVGYGAGGGGGGASLNGNASGKGGDGGPAYARVTFRF